MWVDFPKIEYKKPSKALFFVLTASSNVSPKIDSDQHPIYNKEESIGPHSGSGKMEN